MGHLAELASLTEPDFHAMNDLLSGLFLYSNDRIIGNLMDQHNDHDHQDLAEIETLITRMVIDARQRLQDAGLAE